MKYLMKPVINVIVEIIVIYGYMSIMFILFICFLWHFDFRVYKKMKKEIAEKYIYINIRNEINKILKNGNTL